MKYNTKINETIAQTNSRKSLVPQCLSNLVPCKHSAFTLAEVLITLAIIGVVAAITIPSVVQKYQERVTVTKLKKVYSTLNQAYQMAVIENGTIDQWGLTLSEKDEESGWYTEETMQSFYKFWNVMLKYMKSAKICTYEDDCNLKNFTIKSLDGTEWNSKSRVISILLDDGTMLTGGDINNADCNSDFKTSLTKDVCGDLKFFLNANKSEYTVGKDAFIFYMTKNAIVPVGQNGENNHPFATHCSKNTNYKYNGYGCTAWVIQNENMDYLHCNDLDWDGKHSCK